MHSSIWRNAFLLACSTSDYEYCNHYDKTNKYLVFVKSQFEIYYMQILETKLRLNMHVKKTIQLLTLHATFLFCYSAALFTFEKISVLTFILIYICVFICILDIWNCFIFRLFAMENLRSCLIFEIPLRICSDIYIDLYLYDLYDRCEHLSLSHCHSKIFVV